MNIVQRTIHYGVGFERQLSTGITKHGGTIGGPLESSSLDLLLQALLADNSVWVDVSEKWQSQGSTTLLTWTHTLKKRGRKCEIQYVAVGQSEIELMTIKENMFISEDDER